MTAGAGRVSAPPRGWRRLVRRAGPGTVRARVTAVAGLALTAAVVLGLVVMYRLQLNSADRTIQGQLRTYATQIEQSAASGTVPRTLPPSVLDPTAQAQVLAPDGTVLAGYPRNLAHQPALTLTLAPGSATPVRSRPADRVGLPRRSVRLRRARHGRRPAGHHHHHHPHLPAEPGRPDVRPAADDRRAVPAGAGLRHGVAGRRARAAAGGADPRRGHRDHQRRPVAACPGARHRRRDRPPGPHDERHAGPAGGRRRPGSGVSSPTPRTSCAAR